MSTSEPTFSLPLLVTDWAALNFFNAVLLLGAPAMVEAVRTPFKQLEGLKEFPIVSIATDAL